MDFFLVRRPGSVAEGICTLERSLAPHRARNDSRSKFAPARLASFPRLLAFSRRETNLLVLSQSHDFAWNRIPMPLMDHDRCVGDGRVELSFSKESFREGRLKNPSSDRQQSSTEGSHRLPSRSGTYRFFLGPASGIGGGGDLYSGALPCFPSSAKRFTLKICPARFASFPRLKKISQEIDKSASPFRRVVTPHVLDAVCLRSRRSAANREWKSEEQLQVAS